MKQAIRLFKMVFSNFGVLSTLIILNVASIIVYEKQIISETKYSHINYDSKSPNNDLSSFKEYKEKNNSKVKILCVDFKMKVYSVKNSPNIFQTAVLNKGVRMEINDGNSPNLGLIISDGSDTAFKGFVLSNSIQLNEWNHVNLRINENNDIDVKINDVTCLTQKNAKVDYDISHIAIGTGFGMTRPFDGEIEDFSITYTFVTEYYNKIRKLLVGIFIFTLIYFILLLVAKGLLLKVVKSSINFEVITVICMLLCFAILVGIKLSHNTKTIECCNNLNYSDNQVVSPVYNNNQNNKIKEIKIEFDYLIKGVYKYSDVSVFSLFQTASPINGLRLDFNYPIENGLFLVTKDGPNNLYYVKTPADFNSWHNIKIKKENPSSNTKGHIKLWFDDYLLIDKVDDCYSEVSAIAVGKRVFDDSKPFYGEIKGFSMSYVEYAAIGNIVQRLNILLWVAIVISVILYLILLIKKRPMSFYITLMLLLLSVLFCISRFIGDTNLISRIMANSNNYIGLYLIFLSLMTYFANKYLKLPVIMLVLLVIIMLLTGKIMGLLSIFIFIIMCFLSGLFVYKYFDDNNACNADKIFVSIFIGLALNSYLFWILTHFKVNYTSVYLVIVILETTLFAYKLKKDLRDVFRKINTYSFNSTQLIIVVVTVFFMFYSVVPNYLWDELIAHLYIPKIIKLWGAFDYNINYVSSFFNINLLEIGSHAFLYILGGEYAVRLFYLFLFFASVIYIENFARRVAGKIATVYSALFLLLTPYLLWCMGLAFNDLMALYVVVVVSIQFYYVMDDRSFSKIMLFFVLSSVALIAKQLDMFVVCPMLVLLLIVLSRDALNKSNTNALKYYGYGVIIMALIMLPQLLKNYYITNNPFFPMYNDIFKSIFYATQKPLPGFHINIISPLDFNSLYDLTFKGDKYYVGGANQFLFGFLNFVVLPFVVLPFLYKNRMKLIAVNLYLFISSIFLIYLVTGPVLRYFIISLPFNAILIGVTIDTIVRMTENKKVKISMMAIISIPLLLNFIVAINNSYLPIPYPIKEVFTNNYNNSPRLKYYKEVKEFFSVLNNRYSKEKKALLYYSPDMYFADFKIEVYDWYNYASAKQLDDARDKGVDEFYDTLFDKLKYDFIILTDQRPETMLNELVKRNMIKKEYSYAGFNLYLPNKITKKDEIYK